MTDRFLGQRFTRHLWALSSIALLALLFIPAVAGFARSVPLALSWAVVTVSVATYLSHKWWYGTEVEHVPQG